MRTYYYLRKLMHSPQRNYHMLVDYYVQTLRFNPIRGHVIPGNR